MTGRERWLKEADIPPARLRERFAVNDADEIVWLTGPRKGSRAGRDGVIHSVHDGAQFKLKESRVAFALKHGRWPPDGEGADLGGRKSRDDDPRPPKACGLPGVRKTRNGKFTTHVLAKGRRFDFGLFDDPEAAYRVYFSAKKTLDPDDPIRPAKSGKPNAKDNLRVAIGIIRGARGVRRRPRRIGSLAAKGPMTP
jgi:hypothetical protein